MLLLSSRYRVILCDLRIMVGKYMSYRVALTVRSDRRLVAVVRGGSGCARSGYW